MIWGFDSLQTDLESQNRAGVLWPIHAQIHNTKVLEILSWHENRQHQRLFKSIIAAVPVPSWDLGVDCQL